MTATRTKLPSLVLILSFVTGSCTDLPTTQSPEALDSAASTPGEFLLEAPSPPLGSDARLLRVVDEVPGFGGMFYGEDGRLNVRVAGAEGRTLEGRSDQVRGLARALEAEGRAIDPGNMVLLDADYEFTRLHEWNRRAASLLTLEGVVFTAIDERENRLRVGVTDDAARAGVEAALAEDLEIPLDAVIIDETEPVTTLESSTLRDRVRPVGGGLQLVWEGDPGSFFLCTLGANVLLDGRGRGASAPHFLTNSHCTRERGVVHGTEYWQEFPPFLADRTSIGFEVLDPPFFTHDQNAVCPEGAVCRFSDAAMVQYVFGDGGALNFGSIYRTESFGTGVDEGSLDIAEREAPRFRIVGAQPSPVLGEMVDKVGRTTGWTRGEVVITCGNFGVAGTDPIVVMLCQDAVLAHAAGGDSGSPVFGMPSGRGHVEFYGLLWGGAPGLFVFSALENIEFELGPFRVH